MVTIQTFSSRMEADLAKSMLEANGVRANVSADDQGGLHPSMAFATGAHLQVAAVDVEKARTLLAEITEQ